MVYTLYFSPRSKSLSKRLCKCFDKQQQYELWPEILKAMYRCVTLLHAQETILIIGLYSAINAIDQGS